jgi:hypothetical protein
MFEKLLPSDRWELFILLKILLCHAIQNVDRPLAVEIDRKHSSGSNLPIF